MDLLGKMFKYLPEERITAKEALKHPFFNNVKLPNKLKSQQQQMQNLDSPVKN
jgi:serine/threonine protein kinase